jgi:hypothetical protein
MAVAQTFQNYFYNSQKLYEFRIRIANIDINKDITEAIKNALDAYEVETMTAPKRLPIQEHRDFGKLGPCEVHHIDVAVNYPTIAEQVRQLIISRAGLPSSNVCVYTLNQALQEELVDSTILSQGEGGPIIENPELAAPAQGDIAGQARVTSLLKELEKHSLSKAFEVAGDDKTVNGEKQSSYGKTTNDTATSDTSVVGTTKNYVYRKPRGNK